jgi:hypothetical protein
VEDFFRKLDQTFHLRAAPGEDDARCDYILEPASAQFCLDESK